MPELSLGGFIAFMIYSFIYQGLMWLFYKVKGSL